ncbi:aminotransferase class I/II-fold pyridoxal phosphate-dependent enzyme [Prochlorococcus marinus]|uniref:aminotransferase class I/II-fold pyridoxal phosphate-dependent enzyme n=1 Tax=Prochlorococcus marinus TaxID=1219 RepID=UPI0022B51810|nr:aminotransferase class I/II-fold pyridoxal phosphate-dependent enzyme [Prochlorococcus marinus]
MNNPPNSRLRKMRTWTPGASLGELIGPLENKKRLSLIDLASNDYLGLSQNPRLIEAARRTMIEEGVGAAGSRFITGSRPIHKKLEEELSKWLGFEKVFLFPSGFQANLAAVSLLANRKTTVITDRLIHNSLLTGVKASGAKLKRFAHNNLEDLERLIQNCLKQEQSQPPLVITESLFSMEGTSPNLKKMAVLCQKYQVMLLVDEAHALGVIGNKGKGLSHEISAPITMISGTFGKAFGSGGAFLATNQLLGENLIQKSGAFRYTTALAPPLAGAALEALNLIQENPDWITNLQRKSKSLRLKLFKQGWEIPEGNGPIIPIIFGSDQASLDKQLELESKGLLTVAIRPPTVPEGSARLRIVVNRTLSEDTLNKLLFHLGQRQ